MVGPMDRSPRPFAELHCHSNFSFLDGASDADGLVQRAAALGLTGLAITDHQGLYGIVRFAAAAEAAGIRPVIGTEIELIDAAVPDPVGLVVPARRPLRRGIRRTMDPRPALLPDGQLVAAIEGRPARPRPVRTRLPGHREPVKEDFRGIGPGQRGPHLVLLARDA